MNSRIGVTLFAALSLALTSSAQLAFAASDPTLDAIISHTAKTNWDRLNEKAKESYDHFKYADAQKLNLDAIRELKKTNLKDERLIISRNNLGEAYLADGNLMDATDAFELALESEKELGQLKTDEATRTLEGLGVIYRQAGKYKKAEDLIKTAMKDREDQSGAVSAGVGDSLVDLGDLYRDQKLYSEAEPVYKLGLKTYSECKDVPELKMAYALDKTATMFYDQGKLQDANQLFATALDIKDKHSTFYTATDPHNAGFVYYRCLNGAPNSFHTFTRGIEAEFINIKDVSAVATLTAEIFSHDWYLLKAQVTVHNNSGKPVSALNMPPTLKVEVPGIKKYTPLDSDAIATEYGIRGERLSEQVLHSADYKYIADSIWAPGAFVPVLGGGNAFIGGFPALAHFSPDWQARLDARNKAMGILANTIATANAVRAYKPGQTTIAPNSTETFVAYFPYCKFKACTLKVLLGNTVIEFPFTDKSG